MLELRGVEKRYGATRALGPIDIEIAGGRTTVLIGPSGCGKSTLLRIALGLIRPDTGIVRVAGTDVGGCDLMQLRRRIGYVVQDGGLFPHMTARANVAVMAEYVGWSSSRVDDRIAALVRLARLPAALLDRYPSELSGGQRQRISLMRALMLDPELLLLDEPLGSLDPMIRFDLQQDLRDAFESLGKTVVLVTHDLAEAVFFGHEIVLLDDGRIVQSGSYSQMRDAPADPFVTRFIGAQRGPDDGR